MSRILRLLRNNGGIKLISPIHIFRINVLRRLSIGLLIISTLAPHPPPIFSSIFIHPNLYHHFSAETKKWRGIKKQVE
jgi:hypothetical protein